MEKCSSKPHAFSDQKIQKNFQHHKCKPNLDNTFVKGALEKPHYDFVVAPVAKAANNTSFICKRFYATPQPYYATVSDYGKNILIS